MRRHRVRAAVSALFLVAGLLPASSAHAQGTTERYSLRGFGGWNLGHTDNQNTYAYVASGDTEYNNYNFALNLAAQPSDKLTVRAQAFWGEDLRGRRIDLDYVFAQWAHSPKLKVRVGKVLSPFGLYTEIYDVGTLRPFYLLPQFYSGVTGLLPKAYLGGGLTGVLPLGDEWELEYDAFGGEVRFQTIPRTFRSAWTPRPACRSRRRSTSSSSGVPWSAAGSASALLPTASRSALPRMHADIEQSVNGGPRGPYPVSEAADLVNAYLQWERGPFTVRSELFEAFADTATLTLHLRGGLLQAHPPPAGGRALRAHESRPRAGIAVLDPAGAAEEARVRRPRPQPLGDARRRLQGERLLGPRQPGRAPANPAVDAAMGRLDDSTLVLVVGAQFSF